MVRLTSILTGIGLVLASMQPAAAQENRSWDEVTRAARGQTVYFNAWAGDPQTNAFIARIGDLASKRYGVNVEHAKLKDTAEAVTRVVAEKAAGRHSGGSVDLIWINGPNFLTMKNQGLLFGPFAEKLPNWRYVDTEKKPSNLVDFTVPVEGYAVPWRMAQIVFLYDEARTPPSTRPKSVPALLEWAKANPGRLTHPTVRDFLGATFLKQALYELTPDAEVLQSTATDANFMKATAPLWAWYDALRPHLWREGREYPATGTAQIQLLNDGEISLAISFNPADAAVSIKKGILPESARAYVLDKGTIGNTSFVAVPYNAANKEGAMVIANLLLEPEVQAQAQDPKWIGSFTVLDLEKLSPDQRRLFERPADAVGLPTNAELGASLPEPHPSWMTRIVDEWERRYSN
jgi:putative thiamine transport system substrate-binding protein